jgi:FMN phosphatase YigB (HAD superfamily)
MTSPATTESGPEPRVARLEELEALIEECETVSFDFFDTLVMRLSASPEAVQQLAGFRLSHETAGLEGFYERRVRAERSAWSRHPDIGDADLDAIYAEFPVDEHWNAQAIARARELERTVDTRFVVPRPAVLRLMVRAKGAGKRVIVVTDSYYPRAHFEELLDRLGWSTLVDAIYVSSERKARKDSGTLWSVIADEEHLSRTRFVHFGDNPTSDQERAVALGLCSVLLPRPSVLAAQRGMRHEPGRDWRADLLLGPLVARWGGDPFHARGTITDEHELGFVVYGPILLAFFAWLAHHPMLRRMERLFFSSREGHFLLELYLRLRERYGLRHLPPGTYLPMSRRAVIMASLARSFEPARVTDHGGFQGSVEALFHARLGYAPNWGSRFAIPVRLPADRSYVQRLLEILKVQLVERAATERAGLVSYCETMGLGSGGPLGLVDIGYSGTIQGLLQLILGRPLSGFYMATVPGAAAVRSGGGEAYGCFQDALRSDLRPEGFQRKTVLLEALLTAPHGQLSHFEREAPGGARPVFMANGVSQRHFSMLQRVFEGGLDYCTTVIDTGGVEVLEAIEPARTSALVPVDAAFGGRVRVSENLAQALSMEDAFSGNGEVSGIPTPR